MRRGREGRERVGRNEEGGGMWKGERGRGRGKEGEEGKAREGTISQTAVAKCFMDICLPGLAI